MHLPTVLHPLLGTKRTWNSPLSLLQSQVYPGELKAEQEGVPSPCLTLNLTWAKDPHDVPAKVYTMPKDSL